MVKIKKSPFKNKRLLIIGVAAVLLIGGVGAYIYAARDSKNAADKPQTAGQEEPINLDPPTKEDAQRVDDNKQKIVESQAKPKAPQSAPAPSGGAAKQATKPVITYAGQYGSDVEVGAYVNVFEEGGTCTAVFTQGARGLTKSVKAVRGANSVDCPAMVASTAELVSKGTWSIVVKYDSASVSGTSDARQVEVK